MLILELGFELNKPKQLIILVQNALKDTISGTLAICVKIVADPLDQGSQTLGPPRVSMWPAFISKIEKV